jgi:GTP-binding protein Era
MSKKSEIIATRCGTIAIVGRPNVGKSTLLNHILGQKISITSRKPQTTRQQILGIKTTETYQAIFLDTPGWQDNHENAPVNALARYMNRVVNGALSTVDIIIFMVSTRWSKGDEIILEKLKTLNCPIILGINKVDLTPDKKQLLPILKNYSQKADFAAVVPLAAQTGKNVPELEQTIAKLLPIAPFEFPAEQITDRSERFLAAEIVREKIMRLTGQEIPYATAIEVEEYSEKKNIMHIGIVIYVDKDNQKAIIIGDKGERLKNIGTQARKDIEAMIGQKVFLRLWVKVKSGWADSERALQSLGYHQ